MLHKKLEDDHCYRCALRSMNFTYEVLVNTFQAMKSLSSYVQKLPTKNSMFRFVLKYKLSIIMYNKCLRNNHSCKMCPFN